MAQRWSRTQFAIRLTNVLVSSSRVAEAEPVMRRHVDIFLKLTHATGHSHPHLQSAIGNRASLLIKMILQEPEVRQRLNDLLTEHDLELGQIK